MDIEPGELTVGQLSQRSGVAISALHFYERQGLIISRRTAGNQRRYKRDTLRRVALIRIAQRVGVPLSEVAAILKLLPENRTPTRADWERISECWQAELDRRILHLEQLRDDFRTASAAAACRSTAAPWPTHTTPWPPPAPAPAASSPATTPPATPASAPERGSSV